MTAPAWSFDDGPSGELAEVWCVNDASNAVAHIEGTYYCATCFVVAVSQWYKDQLVCDDCHRTDGSHDTTVEH